MTDIPPALTAEEWAQGFTSDRDVAVAPTEPGNEHCVHAFTPGEIRVTCEDCVTWNFGASFIGQRRHALAALALYGQPFGFTRYELETLREIIPLIRHHDRHGDGNRDPALEVIAAKIAALLPPEP